MDSGPLTFRVRHTTTLNYTQPVAPSYNEVRLRPLDGGLQRLVSFSLTTEPPTIPRARIDYYGNVAHRIDVERLHDRLEFTAKSTVEVALRAMHRPDPWHPGVLDRDPRLEFALASPRVQLGGAAEALWRDWVGADRSWDALLTCTDRMHREFRYLTGTTTVDSSVDDFVQAGAGVCQDFTHLFIAVARCAGWPARYISGYMGPPPEQTTVHGASHAWAEVCGADGVWVAVDPTHGGRVHDARAVLAVGRDYGDVAPHRGLFFGQARPEAAQVSVEVSRRGGGASGTPIAVGSWNAQQEQQQQQRTPQNANS